jgi:hypothetical protein
MNLKRWCLVLGAWFLVLGAALVAAEQDPLLAVRDLYASAAYEDALAALGKLPQMTRSPEETRAIEQYRALCLIALGRSAEAEHAIETVIAGQPSYQLADGDISPRVRAAFTDVRKRMLPGLIQQRYADAKGAFDRKEFSAASQGFQMVLDMMTDPDVAPTANRPPLSDLRTLAKGFHDLAVSAMPPPPLPATPVRQPAIEAAPTPPPPVAPAAVPNPAASATPGAAAPAPAAIAHVYASSDADVVPPVVLRQDLPPYPGQIMIGKKGLIEVVIDENGLVETALMRIPVSSAYDPLALAAARGWQYRPALLNGRPVKYRKTVQVTVRPMGRS